MTATVSPFYLDGIREGRAALKRGATAREELESLNTLCRSFDAQSPVGQLYRGERDFWKNQLKEDAQ